MGMRCVTVLSLLMVDLDLVATLPDLVVVVATLGQVELWETMVLLLPPPAVKCPDKSARMFPASSAGMCQDRWQGRSAPMFQDSNARMFLASNARMFPVKPVRTFPDRSARMCPVSSVSRWL